MEAPTAVELAETESVLGALESAWADSMAHDPVLRHEEGGWIYLDTTSGALSVRRARGGTEATIVLSEPPVRMEHAVIATFHTHPNPSMEGWNPGPSSDDTASAWFYGVPCLIRADDGVYNWPMRRRGGATGSPGYPTGSPLGL